MRITVASSSPDRNVSSLATIVLADELDAPIVVSPPGCVIEQAVPDVVKAVKWNQPLYGVEDHGFFASFRCFTTYVKLTFFAGAELGPVPPVDFKDPNEKAFHIHEDDDLDEQQLTSWFEQAAAIPGWTP